MDKHNQMQALNTDSSIPFGYFLSQSSHNTPISLHNNELGVTKIQYHNHHTNILSSVVEIYQLH
ncbi:MAG: hypothetical protein KGV56_05360 [Gammaproteobacteria bacterium]|nr:hypothetical protein [Gammaproteobacteria bacterium]